MMKKHIETSDALANLFAAMGSPTRVVILRQLCQRDAMTVSDLQRALNLSQPLTSQHLGVLRRVGVVVGDRVGRDVYYRLRDGSVRDVLLSGVSCVEQLKR